MNLSEKDTEEHLHQQVRADYFSEQHNLAYTLIKISSALIKQSDDIDIFLKSYISNVDKWIKDTRF